MWVVYMNTCSFLRWEFSRTESEHDVRAAVTMHEFANVSHHLFAHLYLVLQVYYLQTFSFVRQASISPPTRRRKRLMSNLYIEWNHIKKAKSANCTLFYFCVVIGCRTLHHPQSSAAALSVVRLDFVSMVIWNVKIELIFLRFDCLIREHKNTENEERIRSRWIDMFMYANKRPILDFNVDCTGVAMNLFVSIYWGFYSSNTRTYVLKKNILSFGQFIRF